MTLHRAPLSRPGEPMCRRRAVLNLPLFYFYDCATTLPQISRTCEARRLPVATAPVFSVLRPPTCSPLRQTPLLQTQAAPRFPPHFYSRSRTKRGAGIDFSCPRDLGTVFDHTMHKTKRLQAVFAKPPTLPVLAPLSHRCRDRAAVLLLLLGRGDFAHPR